MRIELKQPYKSIATLTAEELPDFAILIGRNGSGKTQILESLKEGQAVIQDIGEDEIELYDMVSFRTPNTMEAERYLNQLAKITADAFLLSPLGGQPPIETAEAIFNQVASDIERNSGTQACDNFKRNLLAEIRRWPDFTVFATDGPASQYKTLLYEQVMAPLNPGSTGHSTVGISSLTDNSFTGNQAVLLTTAMKLNDKLPHELNRDDIMRTSLYKSGTLANSVSEVFAAYKVEQYIWAHKQVEQKRIGYDDLIAEYRAKYPPPWETLREVLSEMRVAAGDDGLFDFDFSDPDNYVIDMGNFEHFSFKAEMTNRTTGAEYEVESLSSGESVLMALCLASFNHYLGRRLPKLLLLDELDAVLHPSMVAALVRTLKTLFVPQGTKILMTSHSAMTVAALDEADIFRVVRESGHVKVSPATKSEAINELSEGLATVDVGLRIAASDQAKVTILTEGHNAKHLKRWAELNFPKDVHVFEELEQHRSDSQLLAYGRFLGRMSTNTHFVIVWDCDAADKAQTLREELPKAAKVTPFAFARRQENKIARNGIENNYDENLLKPFSIKKVDNEETLLGREFQSNRKTEFANHVRQRATLQDFTHFQDLHGIISGILGSPCKSPCPDRSKH